MSQFSEHIDNRAFREIDRSIEVAARAFPGSAFAPYIRFTDAMSAIYDENPDVMMTMGKVAVSDLPLMQVGRWLRPASGVPAVPLTNLEHRQHPYQSDDINFSVFHEVSHLHLADYTNWGRSGPFDLYDELCVFVGVERGNFSALRAALLEGHPRFEGSMSPYGLERARSVAKFLDANPPTWMSNPRNSGAAGRNMFRGWKVFPEDGVATEAKARWHAMSDQQRIAVLQLNLLLKEGLTDATALWISRHESLARDPFASGVGRLMQRELATTLPDGTDRRSAVLNDWVTRLEQRWLLDWLPSIDYALATREADARGLSAQLLKRFPQDPQQRAYGRTSRYLPGPSSRLRERNDVTQMIPAVGPAVRTPLIAGDRIDRAGAVWLINLDGNRLARAQLLRGGRAVHPAFEILGRAFDASDDRSAQYLSRVLVGNAIGSMHVAPAKDFTLFPSDVLTGNQRFFVTEAAITERYEQELGISLNESRSGEYLHVELHRYDDNYSVLTVTHDKGPDSQLMFSHVVARDEQAESMSDETQRTLAHTVMAFAADLVTRESDASLRHTLTRDYLAQFAHLEDAPIRVPLKDVGWRAHEAGKRRTRTTTRYAEIVDTVTVSQLLRPYHMLVGQLVQQHIRQEMIEAARPSELYGDDAATVNSRLDEAYRAASRLDLSLLHPQDQDCMRMIAEATAHETKRQYFAGELSFASSSEDQIGQRSALTNALDAVGNKRLEHQTIDPPTARPATRPRHALEPHTRLVPGLPGRNLARPMADRVGRHARRPGFDRSM